jgi:hypothetical protein
MSPVGFLSNILMTLHRFHRSPFFWLGLAGLLSLWWAWPRDSSPSASGSVEAEEHLDVSASTSVPAPESVPGRVPPVEKRPASERPLEPRPIAEIHKSLLDQARKTMETGAGGADAATKDELLRRTKEIEALRAGGMGMSHPSSLRKLAEFSRYLDTFAAFDAEAYKTDMAGYFRERLKELDGLPAGAKREELRAKWLRELARDDSPEAILLRSLYGSDWKSQMERLGGL